MIIDTNDLKQGILAKYGGKMPPVDHQMTWWSFLELLDEIEEEDEEKRTFLEDQIDPET